MLNHAWLKTIFQDFEPEVINHVHITEKHLWKVHGAFQDFRIWERAHVKNHLDILLLDEVSGHKGLLRALLGEANPLIDAHEPQECVFPNPMVDINSVSKTLHVELLGCIEVSHLQLHLQAFQVVDILEQVVLPEQRKAESFVSLHHAKSLLILDCFI